MPQLLDSVRKGLVAPPTSRKFCLDEWKKILEFSDSSDERHMAALGILVHGALSVVRKELSFVNDVSLDSFGRRQAILAVANHQCIVAEIKSVSASKESASPARAVMDKLADVRIALALGEFDPDSIIESLIEGAGRLLRMLAAVSSASQSPLSEEYFSVISHDLNLGISYHTIEALWLDIVWHEFRFEAQGYFAPADLAQAALSAVSAHRHVMTTMQRNVLIFARSRAALANRELPRSTALRVRVENGVVELRPGHVTVDEEAKVQVLHLAILLPHYRDIAEVPGSAFPALTLALVCRAYALLIGVADGLFHHAEALLASAEAGSTCSIGIEDYASRIARRHLINAFADLLEIPVESGEEIVRFFVGAGAGISDSIDHWAAPLVALDEESVGVFIAAIRHASLARLSDLWLRRLGFDLEIRGNPFEEEVRASLHRSAAASALSPLTQVVRSDFTFSPKADRSEQIDLVIVLGGRVLVGEIKCFLQPSNRLDQYNHQEKIIDAALQVSRKAEAVRRHEAEFRSRAATYGLRLEDSLEIIPCVVLNHALGVGHPVRGVPIADLRILEAFFEGGLQRNAVLTPRGEVESADIEPFWESPHDAPDKFSGYLSSPPQVRHLNGAVVPVLDKVIFPGLPRNTAEKLRFEVRVDNIESSVS